ncbi:MAG: cell division protein SepF [Anaerorhabdus sp.]
MGLVDKFKEFVAPVDDDEMEEELEFTEEEARSFSQYEQATAKGVSKQLSVNTKMVLFEPRSFEEAEEIARHLKERRAAVVNLHRLQREYAQRTIDFLMGTVFALDGKVQKVGRNVVLCTPRTIGVDGEISLEQEEY